MNPNPSLAHPAALEDQPTATQDQPASQEGSGDELFFITEDVETEMRLQGEEFNPPNHARTQSIRDLYGWQPGESLEEALARKAQTDD